MSNNFKSFGQKNIGNALVVVGGYSPGANANAVVIGLSISNTTGTSINANVAIFDGTNNYYLVYNAPISSGGSLVPIGVDQKLVLQQGYQVKVQTSAVSAADAVMSVMEII
jgi:hypothetical protein